MKALQNPKRVSWPPDFKLCQVRLFMSEDPPSRVGSQSQDYLQAKSPGASHPFDDTLPPGFEDTLPPGFGGLLSANESLIKLSDIPVIKWKCSVRILLDEEWRVVAGEESNELQAQNRRERRVLEAFYPGASYIPPNPSVPADVDNSDYDDQQTIIIPTRTVVEGEDIAMNSASELPTQSAVDVGTVPSITNESTSTSSTLLSESEIMAALSAISRNNEQGSSMIDKDLLIQILSNRKLLENLVANLGSAGSVSSNASSLHSSSTHEANGVVTTPPASSNERYYPQPVVFPPPAPSNQPNYGPRPASTSYYKSLIQQHGGERQEAPPVQQQLGYPYRGPNPEMVNSNNNNQRPRDSKPRIMKPCLYFNTPRGCRNGANCFYQHDATAYQPRHLNNGNINNNPEMQSAKRQRYDWN